VEKETNSLLSEFGCDSKLRRCLEGRWAGLLVAGIYALWVIAAIVLARLAGADCIKLTFLVPSSTQPEILLFGYVAELNHALFHLVASIFVVERSFWLLRKASDAFRELSLGETPNLFTDTGSVQGLVANWNLKIFRWIVPVALTVATITVFVNERPTYNAHHIGWVQAGFFADWQHSTNQSGTNILFDLPGKIADVAGTNGIDKITLLNVQQIHSPSATAHQLWQFLFLFFALGHQVIVYAFGIWIAAKILFLIAVLAIGMRSLDSLQTGKPCPLRVRLTFDDESKRFGFCLLDQVYDTAAMLVLAASIGVLLMFNNSSKDSGGFLSHELWGRILPIIIIGTLLLTLLFLPILIFGSYADSARAGEYARLTAKIDGATSDEERDKWRKKRDLLQEQRAWPARDALFWTLLGLSFVPLVLFPIGMNGIGPDWFRDSIQWVMASLPKLLCGCN
jgi:hypothetical protein